MSLWQVAACVVDLPLGSALMSAIDPRAQYTTTEYLLHRLLDVAVGKHIPFPWEKTEEKIGEFEAVERDEFDEWYRSRHTTEEVC